jgi:uncharacterized sulfatase
MDKRQTILFLIDTQGANNLGCYMPGLPLKTPNVDKLAAKGVRFDRAYTCAPVCGPARSALFTGLFPHSNGVLANDMAPHIDMPTLGQRLRKKGIATGYIGKWHLDGTDYFGDGKCPPGWCPEYWFDGRDYLNSLPDDEARGLSRKPLGPEAVKEYKVTSEFTYAHRVATRAISFIKENKNRDFLLVVSIDEPHHPWICPEPYVSGFEDFLFPVPNADDALHEKPRSQREWAAHTATQWSASMVTRDGEKYIRHPRHFSCNSYSDSQVGRVMDAIDGTIPDALVIYTSDHGDMLGSHGLHGKGPCAYEEIVRIPFIVRFPGSASGNVATTSLVSHIDVVPTVLDYFGIGIPDLLQGHSLLPVFKRPYLQVNDKIFSEFNRFEVDHDGFGAFSPLRCIFDGCHKLTVNLFDTDELYDLKRDPLEIVNLINDPAHGEVRAWLHAEIMAWMNRTRDPLRGPHWKQRYWGKGMNCSSWGGPTRPRPADVDWYPRSLLYDTAGVVDKYEYEKH